MLEKLAKSFVLVSLFFLLFSNLSQGLESKKSRLIFGFTESLSPLNPLQFSSSYSSYILELVFEPLLNMGEDLSLFPALAESWEHSEDGKVWTFHLNSNVKFHNGSSLSSEDVVFTYQKFKENPHSQYSDLFKNIEKMEIRGSYELSFYLLKPDNAFPFLLSQVPIISKKLFYNSETLSQAMVIGSGPFLVDQFSESEVTLKKNPSYYRGKVELDEVIFRVIDNERLLLSQLINEQVDLILPFYTEYSDSLRSIPHVESKIYQSPLLVALFFNNDDLELRSPKIRQALNFSVNKNRIFNVMHENSYVRASHFVPPTHPYYVSDSNFYAYDPEKSIELFKEAGWIYENGALRKGGKAFKLNIVIPKSWGMVERVLPFVIKDLQDIGVEVTWTALDFQELINLVFQKKDYQSAMFPFSNAYGLYSDSILFSSENGGMINFLNYENQTVLNYLGQARFTNEETTFKTNYQNYQKELQNNPPALYLFWKFFPIYHHKKIQGLGSHPYNLFKSFSHLVVQGYQ